MKNRIQHIFNEIENENSSKLKAYIESQKFEIDYIKEIIEKTKTKEPKGDELSSAFESSSFDFEKKYFGALLPVDENSTISKYDDKKINTILDRLGNEILMISGDFWGIQKFIFDGLTSSKAPKILRSRSAMVQLITYVVIDMIKEKFKDSEEVLFGAGKFLILAKNESGYKEKIKEIQKKLDEYFLKNFFGQNGFIISHQETTKEKLSNQSEKLKEDLESLGKDNEFKKLNKFSLKHLDENFYISNIFANSDDEVCKFCGKRAAKKTINFKNEEKEEKACEICANQIELGEKLTKYDYLKITKEKGDIKIFDGYYAKFSKSRPSENEKEFFDISTRKYNGFAKWSLQSYVPKDKDGRVKTFEEMAKNSSGLMALKADVDRLGKTFKDYYYSSFKKFNRLSRELDFFFSDYATKLIEENFKNCYVVFGGGDDLFVIGEYKEIIDFAKRIREEFYKFSLEKATLSVGLVMFKPSTPINYISKMADEAEKRAKELEKEVEKGKGNRNGIDIFGISMKFDDFIDIENEFKEITGYLEENNLDATTFYYRLIEICDMREHIKDDPRNAMWKSKLNYTIQRNLSDMSEEYIEKLFKLVDNYGEKVKPSIFLKIYNNRDKKEEVLNETK